MLNLFYFLHQNNQSWFQYSDLSEEASGEANIKGSDQSPKLVGPFYNAIVVTDQEGNVFPVPNKKTVTTLDNSAVHPWLSLNHPNAEILRKAKNAKPSSMGPKDPPPGAEDIYFLLKTGHSIIWDRLPIHFMTTLTRMPHYQIYSDASLQMGSVEIVDGLQNITSDYLTNDELMPYEVLVYLRMINSNMHVQEDAKMKNGWLLDRFKNIWMLFDAWERNKTLKWYVFFDDDTSIMVNSLTAWLGRLDHTQPLYLGSKVSLKGTAFGHGGSGVAISNGALNKLFGGKTPEQNKQMLLDLTKEAIAEDCGDYMVAVMLKKQIQLVLTPYTTEFPQAKGKFQGEPFYNTIVPSDVFCEEIVSFHHHKPMDISTVWEFENHFNKPTSYRDFYQSFIHPYLAQSLSAWDNRAREFEYSGEGQPPSTSEPWGSADLCQQKCMSKERCVQYVYDPYRQYCGLSTKVSLGRPVVTYEKEPKVALYRKRHKMAVDRKIPEEEIKSGWILERIEKYFVKKECTLASVPLTPITEPFGWWWTTMS